MSSTIVSSRIDEFARRHPRLLVAANLVLLVIVTLALLTMTEAPVVLYQAF